MADAPKGRVVKAKPITDPAKRKDEITEAYFVLCYYYPQYTLKDAAKMRFDHVLRHIDTARKEKAAEYLELLNISTAPHTKKGSGVKKLQSHYQRVLNG